MDKKLGDMSVGELKSKATEFNQLSQKRKLIRNGLWIYLILLILNGLAAYNGFEYGGFVTVLLTIGLIIYFFFKLSKVR